MHTGTLPSWFRGCARRLPAWTAALICCFGPVASAAEPTARTAVRLAQDPTLSPDGRTLVFSWRGDLWSVPTAGGAARALTRHPARDTAPSFSPDGQRLAFLSERLPGPQVYVMPAAGGAAEALTAHSEGYALDGWYPDGSALLVNVERDNSHYARAGYRFVRLPVALGGT